MEQIISQLLLSKNLAGRIRAKLARRSPVPFPGSKEYWESRYEKGGNSGVGSYGKFAQFKAETINAFVRSHAVRSIIEFGCGDGNQLSLSEYPDYLGLDVSENVISLCRRRFCADPHKRFMQMEEYAGESAELALSLDVIYHLVEDETFEAYMKALFHASMHYVILYSSDTDDNAGCAGTHVRHRRFTKWIAATMPGWQLTSHIPNRYPYRGDYREGSFADFFIYEKN